MTTTDAGTVRYGRAVELKTRDEGWTVEGYCSTFGNRDLVDDIILPGAFKRTLADGHPVRFLYAHQADQVLGRPVSLEEDGKGLHGVFKLSKTRLAEDVRTLLLDKALDSFSIGFVVKDSEVDQRAGVRKLKDVDLLECSVVAMPANPAAVVTAAKSGDLVPAWDFSPAATRPLLVAALEREVARLRSKHFVAGLTTAQQRAYVHVVRSRLPLTPGGR